MWFDLGIMFAIGLVSGFLGATWWFSRQDKKFKETPLVTAKAAKKARKPYTRTAKPKPIVAPALKANGAVAQGNWDAGHVGHQPSEEAFRPDSN